MGIFSPFWKKKMDYRQKNYYRIVQQGEDKIAAMTDQALLKRIASESPEGRYRIAAVKKLESQSDLLALYAAEESDYIRETIASKLKESEDLYRIAKTDSSEDVRLAAIKNITDEKVLADIAENDKSVKVRAAAIRSNRIKDNQLLFRLASKAENVQYDFGIERGVQTYFVPGEELLKRITDKDLLMKAVQGDFAGVWDIESQCFARLDTSQILTLAADSSIDKYSHLEIMEKISRKSDIDEHALAEILCREKESGYQIYDCIKAVKDPECLEIVVSKAELNEIRIMALERFVSMDPVKASKYACEMLEDLNDDQKLSALKAIAKAEPEKAVEPYLELTSEKKKLPVRWDAALELIDLAPDQAVDPLVTLLRDYWDNRYHRIGNFVVHSLISGATNFLKKYYKTCGSEQKEKIAGLPNGVYYRHSAGLCEHSDTWIHFDLSDI